jgi:hypothetical protein
LRVRQVAERNTIPEIIFSPAKESDSISGKIRFEEEIGTMYSVHCISQEIVVHRYQKVSYLP